MSSALIVLSLNRIKGSGKYCRRVRKLQLVDVIYDKQSVIDVIIGTDIYSFLLRDLFQHLEEPII